MRVCAVNLKPAVRAGLRWLLALQNRDGGVPTFCRGWGRLPFDRSCPDISAHALAAWAAWRDDEAVSHRDRRRLDAAMRRAADYLKREQHAAGCWLPLWFGHQDAEHGRNPVVGTARVVDALRAARMPLAAAGRAAQAAEMLAAGECWLVQAQHPDGGGSAGARATAEETALAVIALAGGGRGGDAARRGRVWLVACGLEATAIRRQRALFLPALVPRGLYPLSGLWSARGRGRNAAPSATTPLL
jgi:squalene-hopene/tetraprenyl-beta-curcumene cyclase